MKYFSASDAALKLSDLHDELRKATKLAAKGLAQNYLLLTNAKVTGESEARIRAEYEKVPGITACLTYGGERLSQIIRESPRLRMLVPRVYGIGDLSQILDERAYAQAREILVSLEDDLKKFVITDPYKRAANALITNGFVLLLGEPACGKSTIAAALSMGALDEWGCETIRARDAQELVQHSNPHLKNQFFWIDDAFGSTQCNPNSIALWNSAFQHIAGAIRRGARLLLTSRDYIFKEARTALKIPAFPLLNESQVVIEVEKLSQSEREQILYNHVKLGNQPRAFKSRLKPFLPDIAQQVRFSPEMARRLGDPVFTRDLRIDKDSLVKFVVEQKRLLEEVLNGLDKASKATLGLVFMRGGEVASPIEMNSEEVASVHRMGGSLSEVARSVNALEGSLIRRARKEGQTSWQFKHPTIHDAMASLIASDPELLDVYLAGARVSTLLSEVTCGDVGIEGAKLVVPKSRYEKVLARLARCAQEKDKPEASRLRYFLGTRCDRDFLMMFLSQNAEFEGTVNVLSNDGRTILIRLHELGLLSEEKRRESIEILGDWVKSVPDASYVDERCRKLFTTAEFEELKEAIRTELLPSLDETIDEWHGNYQSELDPEEYFSDLKLTLRAFRDIFGGNVTAISQIEKAFVRIDEVVVELSEDRNDPDYGDDDHFFSDDSDASDDEGERSVFDDVDD
jgi:energy-coupling factor transporter ATP-binding protein EcfA2